jgi:hypothetical protein
VIGVSRKDCKRAIELLAEHQTGELVGEGHGAEREQEAGADAVGVCPAVGGTDGEDNPLAAFVLQAAQITGQVFRGG